MTGAYVSTPGTIERRVIDHLLSREVGVEVATVELAEICGQNISGFTGYLASARAFGVLVATTKPGIRSLFWRIERDRLAVDPDAMIGDVLTRWARRPDDEPQPSLVEAKPEVAPDRKPASDDAIKGDHVIVSPPMPPITLPERKKPGRKPRPPSERRPVTAPTLRAVVKRTKGLVPLPDPVPPPAAEPNLQNGDFVCGLFSDGVLVMYQNGVRMVLERAALETLLHFLERMVQEDAA